MGRKGRSGAQDREERAYGKYIFLMRTGDYYRPLHCNRHQSPYTRCTSADTANRCPYADVITENLLSKDANKVLVAFAILVASVLHYDTVSNEFRIEDTAGTHHPGQLVPGAVLRHLFERIDEWLDLRG
jgi:hypothetical protein